MDRARARVFAFRNPSRRPSPAAARTTANRPQSPPRPTGPVSPKVAFLQSRLAWDTTRKQVQAELQKLESAVLAECKDEPDFATIAANSNVLYTVLNFLDERLIDKLDEAMNAATPDEGRKRGTEAREICEEYIDYMAADQLLHDIDDNGFIDMQIQATVAAQLQTISSNLKALGA